MLDRYSLKLLQGRLEWAAAALRRKQIHPDLVTTTGFVVGIAAVPFLAFEIYWGALLCILVNRLCDGLDGALARQLQPSEAGAYLDITLDFIFYGGVVLGFSLADSAENGFAASLLLFAFICTGSTFLGFAILAARRGLQSTVYPSKGFYYLGGLTEGTETVIFFILICLFPDLFSDLAYIFSGLCFVTAISRIVSGYMVLKRN